jgi:transposase
MRVPGASVAAVALSHRINANLVRRWIVRHRKGQLVRVPPGGATLLPVALSGTPEMPKLSPVPLGAP